MSGRDCPVCNRRLTADTCLTDRGKRPSPGDFTICYYCSVVLRFDIGGSYRIASDPELKALEERYPDVYLMLVKAASAVASIRKC